MILLATPTDTTEWSLERLQAYIVHVKTINPVTTEPANQLALSHIATLPSHISYRVMSKYYQLRRQTDCYGNGRTTVRLLESLVRLSQGNSCHETACCKHSFFSSCTTHDERRGHLTRCCCGCSHNGVLHAGGGAWLVITVHFRLHYRVQHYWAV